MLPEPVEPYEDVLWAAQRRLECARTENSGLAAADEALKEVCADFVRGTLAHLDALASFLDRMEIEMEYFERQTARFDRLRDQAEADRKRIRAHVLNAMASECMPRVRGRSRLFLRVVAPKILIMPRSASQLPPEYVREIPADRKADEVKIRHALAAGTRIPGCSLVDDGFRLVVR